MSLWMDEVIFLSLLASVRVFGDVWSQNMSVLLDQALDKYDKRLRPGLGGPALQINLDLNIRSMGPISEKDWIFSMDCYFRQKWKDDRLAYDPSANRTVQLSMKILDRIWYPDTVILNGQRSHLHTITRPNRFLRIDSDGTILFSQRLTIRTRCPMHLEKFPLDQQYCPVHVASFGYSNVDLIYNWRYGNDKAVEAWPDMTMSQFDLTGHPAFNNTEIVRGSTHSVLEVQFRLRRRVGYFLLQVYLPCTLLVALSWVSFWINREATADRTTLGVTTVLTMTFFAMDNRNDLPKVSYCTALDIYLATCYTFILATMLQFTLVHSYTKTGTGDAEQYTDSDLDTDDDTNSPNIQSSYDASLDYQDYTGSKARTSSPDFSSSKIQHAFRFTWMMLTGNRRGSYNQNSRDSSANTGLNSVSMIDKASRILFPLTFIVFNITYWTMYTS